MDYKHIYTFIPQPLNTILLILWNLSLILLSYLIADKYLMVSLTNIISKLDLNSDVSGIFFLNMANGIPDLITSLVVADRDITGVLYATLGSFVFMITMALGACILSSDDPIKINNSIFYKNISFLFITFGYLLFIIGAEKMTYYTTVSMLITYLFFFIYTFRMNLYESVELIEEIPQTIRKTLFQTIKNIFIIPLEIIFNILTFKKQKYLKPIYDYYSVLSPLLNALLIIFYFQINISGLLLTIILIINLFIGIFLIYFIKHQKYSLLSNIYGFIASGIYLYILSSELLNTIYVLETIFDIKPGVFLITFIAWGNCIGDLITGIAASRKGLCKTVTTSLMTAPIHNVLFNFSIVMTYFLIKEKITFILYQTMIYQVMVSIAMITITLMVLMFNYESRSGKLSIELAWLLFFIYGIFFLICFF